MAQEIIGLKVEVESNAGEQLGSLRSQIKAATQDLIAMRDKFGETSPEAAKAAQKVAELKEKMADAKQMADAFSPDKKFAAFAQTLTGVTSGFAAVQGAMGLFGTESKDLEKQLLKVQSAMALAQGLNGILEAKDAFLNLAVVIRTQVVAAFATMRTAIMTTGIGALVVAIGYLISKYIESTDAVDKQKKKEEELLKLREEEIKQLKEVADANAKTRNMEIEAMAEGVEKQKELANQKRLEAIRAEEETYKASQRTYFDQQRLKERLILIEKIYQKDLAKVVADAEEQRKKDAEKRQQDFENSKLKINKLDSKGASELKDPITGRPISETTYANILATMSTQQRAVAELDTAKALSEGKKEIWRLEQEEYIMMADAVSGAMMSLANLVGQQTVAGKGLAIASSTIDTFVAAAKAMKAEYPGDGITAQVLRVATTASVIANGLANVRRIASVQVPASGGSGTGASSVSTPSFSPILQPTMQTTVLNQSQLNLLGGQLMRAYVVESDITNSQNRIRRIQSAAEFGG